MSYPYFFVDKNRITDDSVILEGEDFKHLIKVLRARIGDIVEISDNKARRYKTVISAIKKDEALLLVTGTKIITKKSPGISLFQCLLKKEAMEIAIQKTAEIGAERIIPVLSSRSVAELGEKKIKDKISRWQQIALSASKQCKRDFICEIAEPANMAEIDVGHFDLFFITVEDLCLDDKALDFSKLKDMLRPLEGTGIIPEIAYIVGPEGGFEKEEVLGLVKKGAVSINFGTNIFRAETASIYFMSILDYILKASIIQAKDKQLYRKQ